MVKKVLFTSLILFCLAFSQFVSQCFADAPTLLKQAKLYSKWYPERSEAICKTVVADYPGTDYALKAQKRLIHQYLWAKRDNEAQSILDKLPTDFSSHPDLPKTLYGIAREYERAGKIRKTAESYDAATRIYQQIMQQHSDSSYASKAQLDIPRITVLSLIRSEDNSGAQAMTEQLTADFSGHSGLPSMLYNIAIDYEDSGKYEEAESIYKRIIVDFPDTADSKHALGSQKHLVFLYTVTNRTDEAKKALDDLIKDFSWHPRLTSTLYDTALRYEKLQGYEQAKSIYQQITQRHPDTLQTTELSPTAFRAGRAWLDVPKCQIHLLVEAGEHSDVLTAIDNLIADFPAHPYLPSVVSRIAEQYQRKASQLAGEGSTAQSKDYLQKAAMIWEIVINRLPDSTIHSEISGRLREYETATPKAYSSAGDCYRKLNEYEKSNQYYQRIVNNYPMFIAAGNTLFQIGINYEKMSKSGLISNFQADAEIKAVYEQLLEMYPNCSAAKHAQNWLNRHNSK